MSDEQFNKFADKLQKKIIKKEFEDYNEYIVDLFHNPKNWGKLPREDISVTHSHKDSCGATMTFCFKIKNNIIENISFITNDYGALLAAGSQATILLKGKSLDYTEKLKPIDLNSCPLWSSK